MIETVQNVKTAALLAAGQAPPGTDKVTTVIQWGLWAVSIACIFGVMGVAIYWIKAHRRGGDQGSENLSHLGWVIGAAILGSASTAIVGALF